MTWDELTEKLKSGNETAFRRLVEENMDRGSSILVSVLSRINRMLRMLHKMYSSKYISQSKSLEVIHNFQHGFTELQ